MLNRETTQHFFYLAPIRGITDALFRNIFHSHFPYFDAAVAPFINPQRFAGTNKLLIDILPQHNTTLKIVPQLLYNNADDFVNLGLRLKDLGYSHINWNLGCPAPMVANKQRGSGLLPYPDRITELLEKVLSKLDIEISIKTRLGFKDPGDIEILLPRLELFKLKEIIIHPRIGRQLYRGNADPNGFAHCMSLSSHHLVYNGDITTTDDFHNLSALFPEITTWMIGRGALANPFLVGEIRGEKIQPGEKRKRIQDFHEELFEKLSERLSGPSHLLSRLKQIWAYLIESFPEKHKQLKKIRKANTVDKYQQAMDEIFTD